MSNKVRFELLYTIGVLFAVIPSVISVLQYFPLWKERGASVLLSGIALSGISVLLLCASVAPLGKIIKTKLKTPSAWGLWGVGFMVCFCIKSVIDALIVVCFVSFLGNLVGAAFFYAAERFRVKPCGKE